MKAQRRQWQHRALVARLLTAAVGAQFIHAGLASADTASWINAVDGSWTEITKWSINPLYPNNSSGGANYDVTVDATGNTYALNNFIPVTLSSLTVNSPTAIVTQYSGTLTIPGTLDVQSGTFLLSDSGYLKNATIQTSGDGQFLLAQPGNFSPSFDGVQVQTNVTIPSNATLYNYNGLALDQATVSLADNVGGRTVLDFEGNQTVSGTGTIVFNGNSIGNLILGNETTTFGPGITIKTGTSSGTIGLAGGFVNQGTISAQTAGQSINLIGNWSNNGTLNVSAGTLILDGTFTTVGIGTLTRSGGTVVIAGVLDNQNSTLSLNAQTGSFLLGYGQNSTIKGGAITTSGGAVIDVPSSAGGTFDGVTLAGALAVSNNAALGIIDGLTLVNGNISLNSTSLASVLAFDGTQKLGGTGQVVFNGTFPTNTVEVSNGSLTIGSGITICTGVNSGNLGASDATSLNQGTIASETLAKGLHVDGSWINQGTISAANGGVMSIGTINNSNLISANTNAQISITNVANSGTITVNSATVTISSGWSNTGTISVNNGTLYLGSVSGSIGTLNCNAGSIYFTGPITPTQVAAINVSSSKLVLFAGGSLDNTNNNLVIDANTNLWQLSSGTINGGTISALGGASLAAVTGRNNNLNAVAINCDISVSAATLTLSNVLPFDGRNFTIGQSGALIFSGNQSVNGTNTFTFATGGSNNAILPLSGTLTIGSQSVVQTSTSGGGTIGGTGLSIVNQGSILAQNTSQKIVCAGTFLNQGIMQATNTASLSFTGTWSNTSMISIGQSGLLKALTFSNAGTIDVSGSMIIDYTGSSPFSAVRMQLISGFAGGIWNGPGVNSSAAASVVSSGANSHPTAVGLAEASQLGLHNFMGQKVDSTTLLLSYTFAGDANLDGVVNALDLNSLASHFDESTQSWTDGDFNYDGVVNLLDFNTVAMNFGQSMPTNATTPELAILVPEPKAIYFLMIVGYLWLRGFHYLHRGHSQRYSSDPPSHGAIAH
jgi:hypothetical protein